MTNTKWLSALLAGTALSVASTAAMADTSFITMTRNAAGEGVTFAVAPTADMPAAATEVTISGNVRGLAKYATRTGNKVSDTSLSSRVRILVSGKTETAMGEVGVNARLQSYGGNVDASSHSAYWKISDSLTLSAGHGDSIASIEFGPDWNATGGVWDGASAGLTNTSVDYGALTFVNGPVTAKVAVESNTTAANGNYDTSTINTNLTITSNIAGSNKPAVAGSLAFDAGMIKAQVIGRVQSGWSSYDGGDDPGQGRTTYAVGGGVGFTADMVSLEVAAVTGTGMAQDYTYLGRAEYSYASSLLQDQFSAVSALATVNASETVRLEVFGGMAKLDPQNVYVDGGDDVVTDISGAGAGVFYTPVKQLSFGLGGSIKKKGYDDGHNKSTSTVGVGAWFKF